MDYLQYREYRAAAYAGVVISFKPCYKWITFNT